MINVSLLGGLGNVLFQYAAARHLAEINSTSVRFDVIHFFNSYKRDQVLLQLRCLNIDKSVYSLNYLDRIKFVFRNILNTMRNQKYKEKEWGFDPGILTLKDDITLNGHFQSEKYFKDIESIIRDEFSFRNINNEIQIEPLKQEILDNNSVSVHVRRGDYLKSKIHFDLCKTNYYLNSIMYIQDKINNPKIFVFSDDIEWCKNSQIFAECKFVEIESSKENPIVDLYLMSLCKHNIIANSTFSWWAAWLNSNYDKKVIAPNLWFTNSKNNLVLKDTIPDEWIKIEI